VDHKASKSLQQEFNRHLQALDEHLASQKQKNIQLKQAIVAEATDLITMDNLNEAIRAAKNLQNKWQQIGITDRKQDRILWKAYREACDKIFARRDEEKASKKQQEDVSLQAANALCDRADKLLQSGPTVGAGELESELASIKAEFKQLADLPKQGKDGIEKRFDRLADELSNMVDKHKKQAIKSDWLAAQSKSKLCRTLYNRVKAGESDSIDELEQQFTADANLPVEIKTSLSNLWQDIKSQTLDEKYLLSMDAAREHCILCEIAAGIESPDTDKDLRMQLQVRRLSEGLSKQHEHKTREGQLIEYLQNWYATVGLEDADYAEFESRIERTIDQLFGD
jgi:hypothetical protein